MNNYIPGVDRSHLNDKVALSSLVEKGIKFIFFKGTQADTYVDPTFNAAWQEAKGLTGLCRGVYHFYDPRIDGIVQAKHFLSLGVDFNGAGCLPPVIDVEDLVAANEADTAALNKRVAENWELGLQRINDFLAYVKEQTGRDVIIYTYNNYPKEYYQGAKFPNNPMWLSSLQANCPARYDTGELPSFWQASYSFEKSDMDADYFTGTQSELNALANIKSV